MADKDNQKEIDKIETIPQALKFGEEMGLKQGRKLGYHEGYRAKCTEEYNRGRKDGVAEGRALETDLSYARGRLEGMRDLIGTIESVMAENDGFKTREAWRDAGKIPAWWICALMRHWNDPPLSLFKPQPGAEKALVPVKNIDPEEET